MNTSYYVEMLNYIYEHEYIEYVIATIAIFFCVILWIVLILIPKISKKNKIGISLATVTLIVLLFIGVIQQKQITDSILKDINTECFIEYEGDFDFNKRDPKQSGYHNVIIFKEEKMSLKLFDFLAKPDYSVLKENVESGRYYGKIIYGSNSKFIVYMNIE